MNDQDYIRKAVELADGFDNQTDRAGDYIEMDDVPYTKVYLSISKEYDQWFFDALAAQLVRQADVTKQWHITIADDFTDIRDDVSLQKGCRITGNDRTMNTIKAIVDSKILEAT